MQFSELIKRHQPPAVTLIRITLSVSDAISAPKFAPQGTSIWAWADSVVGRFITTFGSFLLVMICMTSELVTANNTGNIALGIDDQCVEPTDYMRRYHMDVLLHQRDETVLKGIRTKKHSLVGCINCHTKQDGHGQNIPINDEGQFCESCHTYAAVKIDCFQCHRSTPDIEVANDE